jgi:hypothetical protein
MYWTEAQGIPTQVTVPLLHLTEAQGTAGQIRAPVLVWGS